MTIADVTKPDLPSDHKRPARVTVRLDNNVPEADPPRTPEPAEITPAPSVDYDHPPRTRSRSPQLQAFFLRQATTLRIALALVALLVTAAAITIGVIS